MTSHYVLYGLRLTADMPIPALSESQRHRDPDVRVHFDARATAPGLTDALQPWTPHGYAPRSEWVGYSISTDAARSQVRIRYPDGTEFILDERGANIWVSWAPPLTQADAVTYLVGPIIGFVLRWRGRLCLHASCVSTGGRAFAMMGSAGAGKSTTASIFASLGLPVVSDDITAVEYKRGEFVVQPGYPRTCLWPDAAAAFYGHADALPRITPTWDKRHLDLMREPGGFRADPIPLDVVYVLDDRVGPDDPISIDQLDRGKAVVTLVGHTYGNTLLDAEMRAREFADLDRLVRVVPVRRVTPPSSLARITEFCERLLKDFTSIHAG